MIFGDRREAGERLAEALADVAERDAVVLAIPRGGVVVGREVASRLGIPLDVVIPRKIGAPGNPELGLGAVAPGVRVLDDRLIHELSVTDAYLEREIGAQEDEIARREDAYRAGRPPVEVAGKVAVVVDDGIATGGTAAAACRWARRAGAGEVVLAVPVAPRQARSTLGPEVDRLVVLSSPDPFFAVGQWYRDFDQIGDDEVIALLKAAAP